MTPTDARDDQAARMAAVDPARSVIVQAPAGSGKTTLLVERYLGLLAMVDEPEEILAITFTRKAAAEMQDRVLKYLDPAFETDQPHERRVLEKARAAEQRVAQWNLRTNPRRMQIRTIDSFNQMLARGMPVSSQLGPVPTPVDNALGLYEVGARKLLDQLEQASDDPLLNADLKRLLAWRDYNQREIERLIAQLLAKREQWLRVVVPSGTPDRNYIQDLLRLEVEDQLALSHTRLREALARIEFTTEAFAGLLRGAAATLKSLNTPSTICACLDLEQLPGHQAVALDQWRGLVDLLLVQHTPQFRKSVTIRNGFDTASPDKPLMLRLLAALQSDTVLAETLHQTRQLPDTVYPDPDWQTLEALIRVMQRAALELQLVFAERTQCDFQALGEAALRGLGQGDDAVTDLSLYLDHRIQHILVDEFQDTNYSQFQLLECLTRGWQPNDGRSLFLVGDPMQSIYRFREAEVGLFLRARTHGIQAVELEPLYLHANYRSQAQIVDWVNNTVGPMFPIQEHMASGAVAYEPSIATQPGQAPVEVLAWTDRSREAHALASMIQQRLTDHAADPTYRAAIIVRSRSHLNELLPALRSLGVRYRALKLDPLITRPVVLDLLAITQAILNPADRAAVLAILRSPVAGLTLADLDQLAGIDAEATRAQATTSSPQAHPFCPRALSQLNEQAHSRATHVLELLERAQAQWQRCPLRALVEDVWHQLNGPATLNQPDTDLSDAKALFELIEQGEQEGWINDPNLLHERVSNEYSAAAPDAL
ncbi:MAG: UvrD-helicase domain-containing protein, partial [Pseudomonadota bacterium]